MNESRTVVIPGAAGFLGSHLCDWFLNRDWRVVGIDNLLTGSERNLGHLAGEPRFRFVRHDVTTPFFIDDAVNLVPHFASPASPGDYLRHPIHTLKVQDVYGPRMRANDGRVIPAFITAALAGAPLPVHGDGRQTRSFCFVDELLEDLYRLATFDGLAGEVFNLGNPEETSLLELAQIVAALVGRTPRVVHLPLPEDDPTRRRPDIRKAQARLGLSPTVSLEDGLRRTIEWFADVTVPGAHRVAV
jgi:nucleoside-diphosphate-sugar epimerase